MHCYRNIGLIAAAILCLAAPPLQAGNTTTLPAAVADHHLHIQGPAVTAELKRMIWRSPELLAASVFRPAIFRERTGPDALRVLDEARIGQGVLLSEAYMFASPLAAADKDLNVARLTREENAFNVRAALASRGRLAAFISVNPLWPQAIGEVRYWAGKPGVTGVKLHLANSGFRPGSPKDVATLAKFVDQARELDLPLVIHVRNAAAYSRVDAEVFIDRVLSHAGALPVQVAHAGGWGGIDEPTLAALGAYADAIARRAPGTQALTFDLAVTALGRNSDARTLARFVALMRRIGLRRFVLGSDWPAVDPGQNNAELEAELPLTPAEWRQILSNPATYLRH